MRVLVAGLAIVLSLLVAAPLEAQSGPRNCTRTSQNLFVRDVLDAVALPRDEADVCCCADV